MKRWVWSMMGLCMLGMGCMKGGSPAVVAPDAGQEVTPPGTEAGETSPTEDELIASGRVDLLCQKVLKAVGEDSVNDAECVEGMSGIKAAKPALFALIAGCVSRAETPEAVDECGDQDNPLYAAESAAPATESRVEAAPPGSHPEGAPMPKGDVGALCRKVMQLSVDQPVTLDSCLKKVGALKERDPETFSRVASCVHEARSAEDIAACNARDNPKYKK